MLQELESAKEELVTGKNALQTAMDERSLLSLDFESQLQNRLSESELAMSTRVKEFQAQLDDALNKYNSLLSEKGTFCHLITRSSWSCCG